MPAPDFDSIGFVKRGLHAGLEGIPVDVGISALASLLCDLMIDRVAAGDALAPAAMRHIGERFLRLSEAGPAEIRDLADALSDDAAAARES